jgi:hypothetical protein
LSSIKDTHTIQPLPAFDINGNRIPPTEYERKLAGAIVEVHFALLYHHIKKSNRISFNAEAREINILHPPISNIRNPLKSSKCKSHPTSSNNPSKKTKA